MIVKSSSSTSSNRATASPLVAPSRTLIPRSSSAVVFLTSTTWAVPACAVVASSEMPLYDPELGPLVEACPNVPSLQRPPVLPVFSAADALMSGESCICEPSIFSLVEASVWWACDGAARFAGMTFESGTEKVSVDLESWLSRLFVFESMIWTFFPRLDSGFGLSGDGIVC